MKKILLFSLCLMMVACSTTKAKKIHMIKFDNDKIGQSIGQYEVKDCQWSLFSPQFNVYSLDRAIHENKKKLTMAKDLEIIFSGFGLNGVGRFCMKAKGEFYAE